jgi:hypothetical protein
MTLSLNDYLSPAGLAKWIQQIGVTDAPVPRQGVRVALEFFARQMPALPPQMALNFLRAMDLSRPVQSIALRIGEPLIAFRVGNESPFKLFYARPGASPHTSGINPAGRQIVRFKARVGAPALESFTTGAIDVWTIPGDAQPMTVAPRANSTGVMVAGGGSQIIVPRAYTVLEIVG